MAFEFAQQRTFEDYILILKKNKKIIFLVLLIFLFSAIIYNNTATPKYQTRIRIEIKTSPMTNLFFGNYWFDYFSKEREFNSHTEMLKSYVIAKKICERIKINEILKKEKRKRNFIFHNENVKNREVNKGISDSVIFRVVSDITVKKVPDTNLVDIYVTDSNPKICYKVASVISDIYQEELSQMKLKEVKKTISVLTKQLISIKEQLSKSEEKYLKFLEKTQKPFTQNSATISLDRLSDLKVELTKQKVEKVSVLNELNYLKKISNESIDLLINEPILSEDKETALLKSKLFNLKMELEELRSKYRERHPLVISKKNEIKDMEKSLKQRIKTLIKSKENKLKFLNAKIAELSKIIRQNETVAVKNSSLELEYKNIKNELESNKALYEAILNKIKTLDITKTFKENYIFKLNIPRYPHSPIYPNKVLNIVLSLFMGLIFGISAVFLMEFSRTTFVSAEEVEDELKYPVLSSFPELSSKAKKDKSFVLNEHFKMLKAEIILKFKAEKFLLLITSTLPQEGKSFVSLNLSKSFAAENKKTLLINLDLRRPVLNKYFDVNKDGISDLLVNPQKPIPTSGNLMDYPLSDIFYLLYINRKTGILEVKTRKELFRIYFLNGVIVLVSTNKREENLLLGNLLINIVGMDKNVIEKSIEASKEIGERLGEYLFNSGLISVEKISNVITHQFLTIVTKIFRSESAEFTFSEEFPGFFNPRIVEELEKKMADFFKFQDENRNYDKFLERLNIYKTSEDNMYFLPSGLVKLNPNEMLVSEKIKDLFELFKKHFDVIIVDSPPAGIVAESNLLLPYVDGIIYLIKYRSTKKKLSKVSISKIEKNGGRILGLILNFVNVKREKYSLNNPYYKYGYAKKD